MNNSNITRIHEELIPKKTEFIYEMEYNKKLSLRLVTNKKEIIVAINNDDRKNLTIFFIE